MDATEVKLKDEAIMIKFNSMGLGVDTKLKN